MEILLSVVLGELTTRLIDFILSRRSNQTAAVLEDRLQRVLLRAEVIIDEAMGRHITNHAMLQQLGILRDAMHRGYYMLDTFRFQPRNNGGDDDTNVQVVSHSLSLSKLNSLKGGFCSSQRNTGKNLGQLEEAFDCLRSMILEVEGLAMFLTSYPRLSRQPYSMHLLLGNCMFGRQMEVELVLNFLLHIQPHGTEDELEVLPIVGPSKVGKTTLVAHVCKDERVRDRFPQILLLSDRDFRDGKLICRIEGCSKKYQNCIPKGKGVRMLVVVELAGDFNEGEWNRLYSASKLRMTSGSKIIVTSQSDKITKFGTARAVTLNFLSDEAYWNYFKTLTFGSTDPMMHPRLANMAMEIARMMKGSFLSAASTIFLLRENFDIHFWRKIMTFLRGFIKLYVSKFGEHPSDDLEQNKLAYLGRMVKTSEEVMVYFLYECSSQEEVPKVSLKSVVYGNAEVSGRFEAVACTFPIPPYYNYVYSCEIRDLKVTGTKRKSVLD